MFIWAALVSPPKQEPPFPLYLFFAFWILGWAIATVFLAGWCWQMLVGRDEIWVTSQELRISRRPFGRKLRYRLSEVKNLRVLEDLFSLSGNWFGWFSGWWMWLPYQGVLAFDYGASTVRFGAMLDPAEARQIVALIKERFEKYMKAGGTK